MSTSVNSPTQPSDLVRDSEERLPAMLADLARVIGVETPSSDKAAVARGASDFADLLR
ncbi:M20 family peptidase, partial [Burkholderia multivorans]